MTAALWKRELIFRLSNNEGQVRRCIREHSCGRCNGKIPPGVGVDCFIVAITTRVVKDLIPASESLLREVLGNCCDHFGRVSVDLVFKVIGTACKKVRDMDLQLWRSLFGRSMMCVRQATFEQGMGQWMCNREIDEVSIADIMQALLGMMDPFYTGIIERDAFLEAMSLCGGSDLFCSQHLPTMRSWIAKRLTAINSPASSQSMGQGQPIPQCVMCLDLVISSYRCSDPAGSPSPVSAPEEPPAVYSVSSSYVDDGVSMSLPKPDESNEIVFSPVTRLDSSTSSDAKYIVRALRKPAHRGLWTALIRLSRGSISTDEPATRVQAMTLSLRLGIMKRMAWGLSRLRICRFEFVTEFEDNSFIHSVSYTRSHLEVARQASALTAAIFALTAALRRSMYDGFHALLEAEYIFGERTPEPESFIEEHDTRYRTLEHLIALPHMPSLNPPRPGSICRSAASTASHSSTPRTSHARLHNNSSSSSYMSLCNVPTQVPSNRGQQGTPVVEGPYASPCAQNFERILEPQQQTPVKKWRKKQPNALYLFA